MTDVLIKRELLEQVASELEHDNDRYMLGRELRKVLDAPRQSECEEPVAWMNPYGGVLQKRITGLERETFTIPLYTAPRQPEGGAISRERVQAEADAFFDWPTTDKSSVTTTSCLIFARCIAGMVAAERDATIAELRGECEQLRVKLMAIASAEPGRHNIEWAKAMAATGNNEAYAKWREAFDQRDKLAGLLRDERTYAAMPMSCQIGMVEVCHCSRCRFERIDAALAEVSK